MNFSLAIFHHKHIIYKSIYYYIYSSECHSQVKQRKTVLFSKVQKEKNFKSFGKRISFHCNVKLFSCLVFSLVFRGLIRMFNSMTVCVLKYRFHLQHSAITHFPHESHKLAVTVNFSLVFWP